LTRFFFLAHVGLLFGAATVSGQTADFLPRTAADSMAHGLFGNDIVTLIADGDRLWMANTSGANAAGISLSGISYLSHNSTSPMDWRSAQMTLPADVVGRTIADINVSAMAVEGQIVVVATFHQESVGAVGDGLHISTDGGLTFATYEMTELFLDRAALVIKRSAATVDTLASFDDGQTWLPVSTSTLYADQTSSTPMDFAGATLDTLILPMGTESGIPVSIAAGGGNMCWGIDIDGGEIYAAWTSEFLVHSPDLGVTWLRYRPDSTANPVANPFLQDWKREHRYKHLNYRAFDVAAKGSDVWVATNAGVNHSSDGGATWTNHDHFLGALTGDFVTSLAFQVMSDGTTTLWAATQATGIDENQLQFGGQDFFDETKTDIPSPSRSFTELDFDVDRDGHLDPSGISGISWTNDGGLTWQTNPALPSESPFTRGWNTAFSGDTVWVASAEGKLRSSPDGGQTWYEHPIVWQDGIALERSNGIVDVALFDGALWIATDIGLGRSAGYAASYPELGEWDLIQRHRATLALETGKPLESSTASGVPQLQEKTYAFPSPAAPRRGEPITIVFSVSSPVGVDVEVYDAGGALVRTLAKSPDRAGVHSVLWNGKNGRGEYVAGGVYILRVKTDTGDQGLGKVMIRN